MTPGSVLRNRPQRRSRCSWWSCRLTVSFVAVAVVGLVPSALARGAGAPATQTLTVAVENGGHVTSNPAGIDCSGVGTAGCQASFPASSTVQLSATAAEGSIFVGWESSNADGCGRQSPPAGADCTLVLNQDRSEKARFGPAAALQLMPIGLGSLTVSPAGVDGSGIPVEAVCQPRLNGCWHYYPAGTEVSVGATADPCVDGSNCFLGWSTPECRDRGNCVLTLDAGETAVAGRFSRLRLALALHGTGRVTSDPAGIDCQVTNSTPSEPCVATFPAGQRVTLTAHGDLQSTFWRFGCTPVAGDRSRCVKDVLEDFDWAGAIIGAPDDDNFTRESIGPITQVAFRTSHEGLGKVVGHEVDCGGDCTATYDFGKELTFSAQATSADWVFDHWVGACSTSPSCTLNVGPTTGLKAVFRSAGGGTTSPQSPSQPPSRQSPSQPSSPSQQPPTSQPPAEQPNAPAIALDSRLLGVTVKTAAGARSVIVRLWVNDTCSARLSILRPKARRPLATKQFALRPGNNALRLGLSRRIRAGTYVLRVAVWDSGAKSVNLTRRIRIKR